MSNHFSFNDHHDGHNEWIIDNIMKNNEKYKITRKSRKIIPKLK